MNIRNELCNLVETTWNKNYTNIMTNTFFNHNFLSVEGLTKEDAELVFYEADKMKKIVLEKDGTDILKGKVIACLFYEPSSRTFSSFISSSQRLGAGIIPLLGMQASSVAKGETLEDTIRTFGCYANAIVMRHPEEGAAKKAAAVSYVPIVNAGDGKGEHPSQALLDAYTIRNHFSDFSKITFCTVGDLKNGRTVHSNTKLLARLGVKKFVFVSPKILQMPEEVVASLKEKGGEVTEVEDLNEVIEKADILYATRVQKERFADVEEYERLKHKYIITPDTMQYAKKNMILMHPLPRVGEITPEVDTDPRSVYMHEQMQNGLYIRMALLKLILQK